MGSCVSVQSTAFVRHTDCIEALAALPNGQLASGSIDNTVRIWQLADGSCIRVLSGHTRPVHALAALPLGQLASSSHDETVRIWKLADGSCIHTLSGHTGPVYALATLPGDKFSLASGSADKTVVAYDLALESVLREAGLENHLFRFQKAKCSSLDMVLRLVRTVGTPEAAKELGLPTASLLKLQAAIEQFKNESLTACLLGCSELEGIRPLDFETSPFKAAYDTCAPLQHQDQLLAAVRHAVEAYAKRHNIADSLRDFFWQQLRSEWSLIDSVALATQKVWTSAKNLQDKEFCSIFGEMLREGYAVQTTALLSRSLNLNLVTRGQPHAIRGWPKGPGAPAPDTSTQANVCWRGGGFRDNPATREFFTRFKQYRVAQPLATSFNEQVSRRFINRVVLTSPVNAYVQWKVHLDAVNGCDHANLLTVTHAPGELEYLFSPFSAFRVLNVVWSATPSDKATPHMIEIEALSNNLAAPANLPLAPWC
eukprot:TRINITY_DN13874_c0_g1_i1.p1 TRINITY_DN13874_c0_g1~~TRINITY_DN13874_c0_g1_i1.p1  ORF type:complete len:483 (-),score=66.52 TRINITY_DN13874_c0_g1_i1:49-1497(-)